MKGIASFLVVLAMTTACSTTTTIDVKQLSREAKDLLNAPESDVLLAHGDPDFVYVEPSDPDTHYLGYLLSISCSVTYLVQNNNVAIVVTIGPGCHESPRERVRADLAIKDIKGKHIGEVLLTMFGVPDNSDVDTSGSGVLSYELGQEAQRRRIRSTRWPQRWPSQEQITAREKAEREERERKQPCTVDIAFANGIAEGAWAKGGLGCEAKEF